MIRASMQASCKWSTGNRSGRPRGATRPAAAPPAPPPGDDLGGERPEYKLARGQALPVIGNGRILGGQRLLQGQGLAAARAGPRRGGPVPVSRLTILVSHPRAGSGSPGRTLAGNDPSSKRGPSRNAASPRRVGPPPSVGSPSGIRGRRAGARWPGTTARGRRCLPTGPAFHVPHRLLVAAPLPEEVADLGLKGGELAPVERDGGVAGRPGLQPERGLVEVAHRLVGPSPPGLVA